MSHTYFRTRTYESVSPAFLYMHWSSMIGILSLISSALHPPNPTGWEEVKEGPGDAHQVR